MKNKKLWNKDYLLLLQGMGISQFDDILYSLAISYYVYEKTGSTLLMSLIASISMITRTVLLPFSGAIVDRLNQKKDYCCDGLDSRNYHAIIFHTIIS